MIKLNSTVLTILLSSFSATAQDNLSTVDVVAPKIPVETSVFADRSAPELPFASSVVTQEELKKNNITRLSEVSKIDASVTDSYNATGYWDYLNVRGYTLDNRGSYWREGLPINAETSIPLDNKARIEILKGLTGLQSGTSSPGGLVNYMVRRPDGSTKNEIESSISNNGNFYLGGQAQGRFHFAIEELRPALEHANGQRYLVAAAHDWRWGENSLLEFEVENSQRAQPSHAGLSLLGNTLPSVQAPRLNLNNQAWSQPVVFAGLTSTLRLTQNIHPNWKWSAIIGLQDLTTQDRLAYPFGCTAENTYDRFCSDGTFDVYDFRSENEKRRMEAGKISLTGTISQQEILHKLQVSVMHSRSRERFEKQAYNYVGTGSVNNPTALPADPTLNDENTNRDGATTDLFLSDAIEWKKWTLWLGLRRSDLDRYSVRTNGSRASGYREDFLLPWAGLSYKFLHLQAYFNYGEGLETYVTPNRVEYQNPGVFLPAARSRQYEVGIKSMNENPLSLSAFEIHRPLVTDLAPAYQLDGTAKHSGVELAAQKRFSRGNLYGALMWLEAKRVGSSLDPSLNGKRPVNVPGSTARLSGDYSLDSHWSVYSSISREEERAVLPDNSLKIPAWITWDLATKYQWENSWGKTNLNLYIENVLDTKYWKEAPTQYSHIYLYAGTERTLSLSLQHQF